jgi:tetrapyrrole methylase family protein/MazG family protein
VRKQKKIIRKPLKRPRSPQKAESSFFEGISKGLPSLDRAYQMTERASRVGFDWPHHEDVLKKMDEEIEELKEALSLRDRKKIHEEIGDLLFVLVNLARKLHVHPDGALKKTIEKFTSRFLYIEASLRRSGKSLKESSLEEMDRLWDESKKKEKRRRIGN